MWIFSYWVIPCFSSIVWLSMLMSMLLTWAVTDGAPIYPSMEPDQTIAYISDVGAQRLRPWFIAGGAFTTVTLNMAFLAERWLRHKGRLARNQSKFEKVSSILSILASWVGMLGMILLTVFDTLDYPTLHDYFLCIFLGGYIVSAIFICAEYQRLGIKYRHHQILRVSFWIKLTFIFVEFGLAIAFGVLGETERSNAAAVVEWTIAFIFTAYVFSFLIDLLPSVRTRHHVPQGEMELWIEEQRHSTAPTMTQVDSRGNINGGAHAFGSSGLNANRINGSFEIEQPLTNDSAGPKANRGKKFRQVLGRNF